MKKIKVLCAAVAMTAMAAGGMAQEPPEAVNVYRDDGSAVSTLFEELIRIEMGDGELSIVGDGQTTDVAMRDVRKITFGARVTNAYPVTFGVRGDGRGTLTANVADEDMREIRSGDKVDDGRTVLFTAVAELDYKVKGWWIDGAYNEYDSDALYQTVDGGALDVKVEFAEEEGLGNEAAREGDLRVYVHGRESIVIESSAGIKHAALFDTGGRQLYTERAAEPTHTMTIPAGGLSQGVYVLRISTTESEETHKVIIK